MDRIVRSATKPQAASGIFAVELVLDIILQVLTLIEAFARVFGIDLGTLFGGNQA